MCVRAKEQTEWSQDQQQASQNNDESTNFDEQFGCIIPRNHVYAGIVLEDPCAGFEGAHPEFRISIPKSPIELSNPNRKLKIRVA